LQLTTASIEPQLERHGPESGSAHSVSTGNVNVINPLADSRWVEFVSRHPQASAFHQRGWLEALARTYGYEPFVITSAQPGEPLNDGIVLCRISSWMTGTRLVSLPFSDHCEPLVGDAGKLQEFMNWLRKECDRQRWLYVELRPSSRAPIAGDGMRPSRSYWLHDLDIRPRPEDLLRGLHKNSFQRKIRRAERERLSYQSGRSELVDEFYRLLLITRRRHRLPPQPRAWFRNLTECMGDKIQIRLVRKDSTPIAATLTLRHRSSLVYKYGCSDAKFHNLGGVPFLLWRLVEESKLCGVEKIDFGRSDLRNDGLTLFKDRFGTRRTLLTYYRYANAKRGKAAATEGSPRLQGLLSVLPDTILSTAGRILYKHIG
jgi:CelD/BcsL family acetyltransferase involved in cellulose biosynthesis